MLQLGPERTNTCFDSVFHKSRKNCSLKPSEKVSRQATNQRLKYYSISVIKRTKLLTVVDTRRNIVFEVNIEMFGFCNRQMK